LSTSLTSQLDDVPQLTHIKLYHTATDLNLNMLASQLPELRCLEGLPYRNKPENYWPLRQCPQLEKLIMLNGCVATLGSCSIAFNRVELKFRRTILDTF
jgi:hypothetical protein